MKFLILACVRALVTRVLLEFSDVRFDIATLWLAVRFWLIELALIVVEDVLVVFFDDVVAEDVLVVDGIVVDDEPVTEDEVEVDVLLVVGEELVEEPVVELRIELVGIIVDEADVVEFFDPGIVVVEVVGELMVVVGTLPVVFPIVVVVFRDVVRFLMVVVMELAFRDVETLEVLFVAFSGMLKVLDIILGL